MSATWATVQMNVPQAVAAGAWFDLDGFEVALEGGVLMFAANAGDSLQIQTCADPNGAAPLNNVLTDTVTVTGVTTYFRGLQTDLLAGTAFLRYIRINVTAFNTGSSAFVHARRKG